MKHIKLFEQFEDDPFGEDYGYYEDTNKFLIGRFIGGGSNLSDEHWGSRKRYYIIQSIIDNNILIYKNKSLRNSLSNYDITPLEEIGPNDIMTIYDEENRYTGNVDGPSWTPEHWEYFEFKDLPDEIKNKLQ